MSDDEAAEKERKRAMNREACRRYRARHADRHRQMSNERQKKRRALKPEETRKYQRQKQAEHRKRDAGVDVLFLLQEKADRFWDNVAKTDPEKCWVWKGSYAAARENKKYGLFYVAPRKKVIASRAAYMLANGPIPDGLYVCHKCDNPPCVNPNHLFAGTPKENCVDKVIKGRVTPRRGEKINAEIAREIFDDKSPYAQIAKRYNISRALVHKIKDKTVWGRIHQTVKPS